MVEALRWYLALLAVGGAGLLPATLLFSRTRSAGLLYARPLALLLVAQIAWLASALTPIPYGTPLVAAALALLWAWTGWLAWHDRGRLALLRSRWRVLAAGEAVFLVAFVLVLVARAQAPAASATEKPMDLAILSAVHRAEQMPPPDPWLAGYDLSYYHLGHVMVDVGGRLAGVGLETSFLVGLAATAGMAAAAVFGLAGDVVALSRPRRAATPWVAGGLALLALLWLAPFEGLAELAAANGLGGEGLWGRLGVEGLPGPAAASGGVPEQFWWWWRATRVVPGTISEFPAFSLLLGDLHAHVLALPLALVAIGVALTTFEGGAPLTWRAWLARPDALLLAGALFAGIAMTNSWDVVTYGALWLAAATAAFLGVGWPWLGALFGAVRYLALPAVAGLVIAAPLLGTLESSSLGLALNTGRESDPLRLALVWGPLALALGLAVATTAARPTARALVRGLIVAAVPVAVWVAAALGSGEGQALGDRGAGWLTLAALVAIAGAGGAAAATAYAAGRRARAAWLALTAAAAAIVLAAELVRVTDVDAFGRLNTVFKFWYAAWALLAVAAAAGLAQALDRLAPPRRPSPPLLTAGAAVLLLAGCLLYTPAMAVSRAREGQTPGLDALAFLEESDPGSAAAVRWARAELDPEHDVLLEAVGADYGPGNLVSAASGVPTLLGWAGHEVQWHPDAPFGERRAVLDAIFTQGATGEAGNLARAAGVTHVLLGREERAQYGIDLDARFAAWPTVFEAAGTRIVEVPVGDTQ